MKVGVQYSVHYRRPRWGSLTQQHAYRLRKAHFQDFETHLSQKKLLWKIPITFPFDRRHLVMFLQKLFVYGGHLVMRSEGCTVAKLENHLKFIPSRKWTWNLFGNKAICKDISCITYNNQTNWWHIYAVVVVLVFFAYVVMKTHT